MYRYEAAIKDKKWAGKQLGQSPLNTWDAGPHFKKATS